MGASQEMRKPKGAAYFNQLSTTEEIMLPTALAKLIQVQMSGELNQNKKHPRLRMFFIFRDVLYLTDS